jgi:zinc transport system substrate-binding protein
MRIVLTLVMVALLAATVACGADQEADEARVAVVTAFYPLEEAARRVGGDGVAVTDLTPPGVEPHDLELSPADLEAMTGADLVLYLGAGFQPAVEDALAAAREAATVDVLEAIGDEALLADPEGEFARDPHVWLDPARYAAVVRATADALSRVDPAAAAGYAERAEAFAAELSALDEEFAATLGSCERDLLVTGHEAFGYLADAYGLEQVGISGVSPEAEPGPQRLAEIRALVDREGVTTVFAEDTLPVDAVRTIATETGATIDTLDTLETRASGDYRSRMRANLRALAEGLGCD